MTVTDAILETWRRNTEILTNILQALPEGGIDAMDTGGTWTVAHHLETGEAFGEVYAHPTFYLQHMIWHQAYHMGQIVWALKQSGMRFSDEQSFEMVWKVLRK